MLATKDAKFTSFLQRENSRKIIQNERGSRLYVCMCVCVCACKLHFRAMSEPIATDRKKANWESGAQSRNIAKRQSALLGKLREENDRERGRLREWVRGECVSEWEENKNNIGLTSAVTGQLCCEVRRVQQCQACVCVCVRGSGVAHKFGQARASNKATKSWAKPNLTAQPGLPTWHSQPIAAATLTATPTVTVTVTATATAKSTAMGDALICNAAVVAVHKSFSYLWHEENWHRDRAGRDWQLANG